MGVRPGERVGAFEVLDLLGAGGMGEVYRARDTRLAREVALKVLPKSVSQDAHRLARFEREARFLAALNHPGIGAIYGIEESLDGPLLVLELVPGETLGDRLPGPALPMTEALSVCRDIADAVAYAHGKGVIHRDLKPANVKRTPDARVKVLDFGLAKALASDMGADTKGPTITHGETRDGAVLGTPAYMSPEQARGAEVDKRTDVWSFGCVLYETLTGRRAFQGETVSDTLVAVLGREPDWSALPASTPASIKTLLRRCLQRDPERRLHDMADARIELEDALAAPDPAAGAPMAGPGAGTGVSGLEIASVAALALSIGAYLVLTTRLLGPLAGLYTAVAMEFPLPLRINLLGSRWFAMTLAGIALVWAGFLVAGRPAPPALRRRVLVTCAAVVTVWTLSGLLLTLHQAVLHAMRLSFGAMGVIAERDLVALHLAAGDPAKAIARLDPKRTRDLAEKGTWGEPGLAFQLAEAYRAEGDLDAARRLYRRALEGAAVFDDDLSQRMLFQQQTWEKEYGLFQHETDRDWGLRVSDLRALPDLVRAIAQRRLDQLPPAAPAASPAPPTADPR